MTSPREIYFQGKERGSEHSYFSVSEYNNSISVGIRDVFNPDNDEETDEAGALVSVEDFLAGISIARQGGTSRLEDRHGHSESFSYVELKPGHVVVGQQRPSYGYSMNRHVDFDTLFLDTFSVIENLEPRKRTSRDIQLGPVESTLVQLVAKSPEILRTFSPRGFEVFVGSFLAKAGFHNIRLSRFVKDGGYDIYAVSCEGDLQYSVVVEVKHYSRAKVGIEIVDRLNGVRSREGVDRGIILTSSSFTAGVRKEYNCKSKAIALIDYDRLVEILQGSTDQWTRTSSDIWLLPRRVIDRGERRDAAEPSHGADWRATGSP